jgi:hypothetical protein
MPKELPACNIGRLARKGDAVIQYEVTTLTHTPLVGQAGGRYKPAMPSPEARAAFDEAQRYADQMRDIHSQELALASQMALAGDRDEIERIKIELVRTRREWTDLAAKYTEALKRYTGAVEKAHQ